MFEKYKLDELYIGFIIVIYPDDGLYDISAGGLEISRAGYGYLTILKKIGENEFVDLTKPDTSISMIYKPDLCCATHTVTFLEPLSYYISDNKKEIFSKREAIKEARLHYDAFCKNYEKSSELTRSLQK